MKGSKTINAGILIERIIEEAESKNIKSEGKGLSEEEKDEILFSLGFCASNWTLNVEW